MFPYFHRASSSMGKHEQSIVAVPSKPGRRRSFIGPFKREMVKQPLRAGISFASVALASGGQTYRAEKILETYYSLRVDRQVTLVVNHQHVNNPACKRDRGPVSIFGLRAHSEF